MNDAQVAPISADDLCDELIELRGEPGRLTVHKFARHPKIAHLYGGDLTDGYLAFKRELQRLTTASSKYAAAAAWSLVAPAESVLDRLVETADRLAGAEDDAVDQRTVRRWSDRGMYSVAEDLIAFAGIRGTYGQDLIGITVAGTVDALRIRIVQVTTAGMRSTAPVVTYSPSDSSDSTDLEQARMIDLATVEPAHQEADEVCVTKAWNVALRQRPRGVSAANVQVMALRTPSPVFVLRDETHNEVRTEFALHRALLEVTLSTAADF